MKNIISREFKYKHIPKLPWLAVIILTLVFVTINEYIPLSFSYEWYIRFFIFGLLWWFIFQSLDELVVVRFRRKVLYQMGLREQVIDSIINEIDSYTGYNPETYKDDIDQAVENGVYVPTDALLRKKKY